MNVHLLIIALLLHILKLEEMLSTQNLCFCLLNKKREVFLPQISSYYGCKLLSLQKKVMYEFDIVIFLLLMFN